MRRRCRIACLLLSCLVVLPTLKFSDAQADSLYVGEVEVRTRQEEERRAAMGDALVQVLVRLTGRTWLNETEILAAVHEDAEPYIRSYRYKTEQDPRGIERTVLSVTFEWKFLRDLMEVEKLSLWPAGRSSVIVWAVSDDQDKADILSAYQGPAVAQRVANYAKRYGMTVRLPFGDIQDRKALTEKDILAASRRHLRAASERYLVDGILVGTLRGSAVNGWTARWQYFWATEEDEYAYQERQQDKDRRGPFARRTEEVDPQDKYNIAKSAVLLNCQSRADCVVYALDALRELLVSDEAIIASELGQGVVPIRVGNIKSFTDYRQSLEYLNRLSLIESATPIAFERGAIVYELVSQSSLRSLYEVLEKDTRLELVSDVELDLSTLRDIQLKYLWSDG